MIFKNYVYMVPCPVFPFPSFPMGWGGGIMPLWWSKNIYLYLYTYLSIYLHTYVHTYIPLHYPCILLGFAITWHVHTPAALFQPQGIGHWTIPSDSLALQGKRSPIRAGSYRQLLHGSGAA